MGRPNQGGVREVKGGWEARATVSKNPPVRRRHTFVEKEDAEAWLAAVKAAADSKLPPPEPSSSKRFVNPTNRSMKCFRVSLRPLGGHGRRSIGTTLEVVLT